MVKMVEIANKTVSWHEGLSQLRQNRQIEIKPSRKKNLQEKRRLPLQRDF